MSLFFMLKIDAEESVITCDICKAQYVMAGYEHHTRMNGWTHVADDLKAKNWKMILNDKGDNWNIICNQCRSWKPPLK